ncbi:hypothetical protein [Arthrobacter sp. NEB 688]|uniref:T3SS (YopN, CesT) and YbjN peptide-binding chaperone 1 n=1 Tax=Arthrobacter sp. NEB 688 TaxID=904039 RepID=UPI0015640247|nr:hypothetical protein [Arthrobacter sp. NEB 688]QKE84399.1 hypothetical protein HL663_10940 [Arthrobacter sp. NEB 688]
MAHMGRNEQSGVDLERSIEEAWSQYEGQLLRRLDCLEDGQSIFVQTQGEEPTEGALPYVQVLSFAEGSAFRLEASSEAFLEPTARTGLIGPEVLDALGFAPPSEDPADDAPNWFRYANATECELVAETIVRVLREAFGVVHPLLLAGMPPGPEGLEPTPSPIPASDLDTVDLDLAHPVASSFELMELVRRTMATAGENTELDEDGDVPFTVGHRRAYVRVMDHEPTVRLFCVLVHGIKSQRAAQREVGLLNRDAVGLRFVTDHGLLMVEQDVQAAPFVPRHLVQAIERMRGAGGNTARDFALRTGGAA